MQSLVLKKELKEHKAGPVWGKVPVEGERVKEEDEYGGSTLYTCMKTEQ
jgi:hypothetical protein